jgi:hypothetical protein
MMLGKHPAQADARNLKLRAVLRADAPAAPPAWDFDEQYEGALPSPMFANDRWGCCVIAARAHQTLRLELAEQGGLVGIEEEKVVEEYLKETGGTDAGLYVLGSLKRWRTDGWEVGWTNYKIRAFAQLDHADHEGVEAAIYGCCGVGIGLSLPLSAQTQFLHHQPWYVTGVGGDAAPNSWGGHYVYCPAYNPTGPIAITWGRRQQLTWGFVDRYADEVYSVIDDTSPSYRATVVDTERVNNFLGSLT